MNFPEISMSGMYPWGAYGATPQPRRFQRRWNTARERVSGGFPYSEGIFEDINKALYGQFYWKPDQPAVETLREYIGFEYGPEVVSDLLSVIEILEKNHARHGTDVWPDESAVEAYEVVRKVESKLAPRMREGWRWRILSLRTQIDAALHESKGRLEGPVLQQCFDELASIYRYDPRNTEAYLRIPMQGRE